MDNETIDDDSSPEVSTKKPSEHHYWQSFKDKAHKVKGFFKKHHEHATEASPSESSTEKHTKHHFWNNWKNATHRLEEWAKKKTHWSKIRKHLHNIYDKVKNIQFATNYTRNEVIALTDKAELLYEHIMVHNKKLYADYQKVCADIDMVIEHAKDDYKKNYKTVKILINDVKSDIENIKHADFEELKEEWHTLKGDINNVTHSLSSSYHTLKADLSLLKNDTKILVDGVKYSIPEIKEKLMELLEDAKKSYNNIIEHNQDSYKHAKDVTTELLKIIKVIQQYSDNPAVKEVEKVALKLAENEATLVVLAAL